MMAAAFATTMACGAKDSDEKLLPPPMTTGAAGAAANGAAGSASAGAGAPAMPSGSCPAYQPDQCPGVAVSDKLLCVSLKDDPEHCGSCETACEAQAVCVNGTCGATPQELATLQSCSDGRLAIRGDRLFWNQSGSGTISSVSISGGTVTTGSESKMTAGQPALDDTSVYWALTGGGTSTLMKAPQSGDAAAEVLKSVPGPDLITGVAVASGKLFYGLGHDVHAIATDAADATDEIVGVAVARNDTRMPDGIPNALTVSGDRVYWIVTDVGSVESDDVLPGVDGYARIGHSGQMWPNDVGFAGDYAYYAAFGSLYAAQANQPAIAIASISDASVGAFAIASDTAFFSDDQGRLFQHGLELPAAPSFEPSAATQLARGQEKITSVVLDATHVYWMSAHGGSQCSVRSLPR